MFENGERSARGWYRGRETPGFRNRYDRHPAAERRVLSKSKEARNGASVILAHNHPSGNPEPSQADKLVTRRLKDALAVVDVEVRDHLSSFERAFRNSAMGDGVGKPVGSMMAVDASKSGCPEFVSRVERVSQPRTMKFTEFNRSVMSPATEDPDHPAPRRARAAARGL